MREAIATYAKWMREDEADSRLTEEVANLFSEAQALGRDHYAPHCVAEEGLEYLTDEDLYLTLIDVDEAELERAIDAAL